MEAEAITIVCPGCRMRYIQKLAELPNIPVARLMCWKCGEVFEWVRPLGEDELERVFWQARWELENPSEGDREFAEGVKIRTRGWV